MTKQPTKSELARELRSRFPDAPTLTLAKKLAKEHFETFLSVEEARSILRYIEGKKGVQSRKDLGSKREFIIEKERSKNPFNLPKSYAKGRKHFDIKGQKVLKKLSQKKIHQ